MVGLASAATAVTALAVWLTPAPEEVAIVIPAAPAPQAPAVPAPAPAAPKPQPAPNPRAKELLFSFLVAGDSYVRLADIVTADDESTGIAMPRHGRARLVSQDGVQAAVAPVKLADVPAAYRVWAGRSVTTDTGCTAAIVGFSVVSRLIGDPGYAAGDIERWTAATVMEAGAPMLVAQIDTCAGTYARDTSLPPVVVPVTLRDPALEQAGIAALRASAPAEETQREWDEQLRGTSAAPRAWIREPDAITAQVVRHPGTGETFVSVHGHVGGGCGDPQANVWGLFRVVGGKLETVALRQLGALDSIDALLDVDGDGELELLGKPWISTTQILTDVDGNELDQLKLPFYGCPC